MKSCQPGNYANKSASFNALQGPGGGLCLSCPSSVRPGVSKAQVASLQWTAAILLFKLVLSHVYTKLVLAVSCLSGGLHISHPQLLLLTLSVGAKAAGTAADELLKGQHMTLLLFPAARLVLRRLPAPHRQPCRSPGPRPS